MIGNIIKSTGSWYLIRNDKGEIFNSRLRGKFKLSNHKLSNPLATGDKVEFDEDKDYLGSYIINKILPRKNYLIRKSIKKKNNGQNECYTKYMSPNSLDHIQAHMLNNNLTVLDNQNKMRRKIREQYKKCLSGSKDILIPEQKSLCDSCSNLFIIKVICKQTRDKLREYLNHYSIDTKIHINIEHDRQRDTQQIKHKVKLVNMQNILDCVLYFPMYFELSQDKIKFISLKLKKYFHRGNLMRSLYKKVVNDLSADKTKTYKFASINKAGFMTWFKDDRTTKQERITARALIKSNRITF